jgi:hypothetical protein
VNVSLWLLTKLHVVWWWKIRVVVWHCYFDVYIKSIRFLWMSWFIISLLILKDIVYNICLYLCL